MLFCAPPALAGALWHFVFRRRVNRLPYRRRVLRRLFGGAGLLAGYALGILGMFFAAGYPMGLSAMGFVYGDGDVLRRRITASVYGIPDGALDMWQLPWYTQREFFGLPPQAGEAFDLDKLQAPYGDSFTRLFQDGVDYEHSCWAIYSAGGELCDPLGAAADSDLGYPAFHPVAPGGGIETETRSLPVWETRLARFLSHMRGLIEGEGWAFQNVVLEAAPPEEIWPFDVPKIPWREQLRSLLTKEYTLWVPVAGYFETKMYEDHVEVYFVSQAWGQSEVDAYQFQEGDSTYFFCVAGTYSPLRLAFSDFSMPTRVMYDDGASAMCRISFSFWARRVIVFSAILLFLFLLAQIFLFSRRERREAQNRARLLLDVAHELKTPMGSVMLKGEEVLEGETLEEKEQSAEEMLVQIERMRGRLNEVLQNARLESLSVPLRPEAFSLREAAEDAIDQVITLAEAKELSMELRGDDIAVEADRTYIVRAAFNFLTNAVNYTPVRGQIVCSLGRERSSAVCSVYNSGSRIPKGELKKIWQQFYKIGDGGDNAKKGTGVGLSTVKSIIALHGGACGCRSVDGGVVFWFRIPMRQKKRKSY
jgi:signal transduction histidine kinase